MPLGIFVPAALNDLAVDVAVGTPAQGSVLYKGSSKWNSLPAGTNGQVLTAAGAAANPSWTTLPADTDTLATLTDVSLSGTAHGQILYRGASAWNNLGVGTSGQFLQTQGAAANPIWATLPAADLSPAVILAPSTSGRNLIQPTGDAVVSLTLKKHSATHSSHLFETQDASGNAEVYVAATPATYLATPQLLIGPAPPADVVPGAGTFTNYNSLQYGLATSAALISRVNAATKLGVGTLDYYLYNPSAAAHALVTFSFGLTGHYLDNGTYDYVFAITDDQSSFGDALAIEGGDPNRTTVGVDNVNAGFDGQFSVFCNDDALKALVIRAFSSTQTGNLLEAQDANTNPLAWISAAGAGMFRTLDAATNAVSQSLTLGHSSTGTPAAGFGSELRFQLQSSTTANRDAAGLVATWATATDASRKGRAVLNAFDTAAREVLRAETNGSSPMVGFLGATAVLRQTLAGAATDAATTQTLANSLRTALINLGLGA